MGTKKKYLISWVSEYNDFETAEGGKLEVNYQGPSFDLNLNFFDDHDKHILISTAPEGDPAGIQLQADLSRTFSGRKIELIGLDINDPNDLQLIRSRIEPVLEKYQADANRIDLMFTTGTTIMRLALAMIHLSSNAPTRLIQGKDPKITGGRGQFEELILMKDEFLGRLYIKAGGEKSPAEKFYKANILEKVYHQADRVAQMDQIPALILGASGTGKEYLARYIHKNSARHSRPFISVNCASVYEPLLQSELFGYIKDSHSAANRDQPGYFEAANQGTIFLDEIGDISPNMQKSLLRVIQEKEVLRVGDNAPRKIDVRIIAATHQDLENKVEKGEFREDLFFRLNIVELHLPDFEEYQKSDKDGLIYYLLQQKAHEYGRKILSISDEVMNFLHLYPFRGNIRELENLFTYFYVFADGEITMEHLPPRYRKKGILKGWTMEDVKARHAQKMLGIFKGNLTQTSKALNMSYNTLTKLIKKHQLIIPAGE